MSAATQESWADIGLNIDGYLYRPQSSLSGRQMVARIVARIVALRSRMAIARIPVDILPILQGDTSPGRVIDNLQMLYDALSRKTGSFVVSPVLQSREDNVEVLSRFGVHRKFGAFLQALGAWGEQKPRFLLEILNEPEPCGSGEHHWEQLQDQFYRMLRASYPHLSLVLTGACRGTDDALMRANLTRYARDRRTYFTFHFYKPYVFTEQDVPWATGYPRYTQGLSLFPGCLNAAAVLRAFQSREGGLPADRRAQLEHSFSDALTQLADTRSDWAESIRNRFQRLRSYFADAGVEPSHVFLGEFGAMRGSVRHPRAPSNDRLFWVEAMRNTAASVGFPWAYWAAIGQFGIWNDWSAQQFDDPALAEVLAGRVHVAPPACARN